ncbi:class I SAM-dependent methyltransferase [Geodermatophilus sp. URMC 62]|uniref:class I SAM-dependent methyltransferase n=1 Tax=Geodermatophilus sp. URMC 62 TaxID=3423414 RepID=UPI00406CE25E
MTPSFDSVVRWVERRTTEQQRELLRRTAQRIRRRGPAGLALLHWVEPLSRQFGFDRGLPVDRHYIEQFLEQNAHLVRGRVLEIGDDSYTRQFGGDRVTAAEVLNVDPGVPGTTYVADLADAPALPSDAFDCVVLTQTLHLIYDMPAAVQTVHRVLRPGGVALATVPGISQLSSDGWEESWYWSLTPLAAGRLFGDVFGPDNVEVSSQGNVAASVAFLEGIAVHELRSRVLTRSDPQFPLLVTVQAAKPAESVRPGARDGPRT